MRELSFTGAIEDALAHAMAGPAHALDESRYTAGRTDLTDQLHVTDIDTQLQGSCCHEGPQMTGLK